MKTNNQDFNENESQPNLETLFHDNLIRKTPHTLAKLFLPTFNY